MTIVFLCLFPGTIYGQHVRMDRDMRILVYCMFPPSYGPRKIHAYDYSRFIMIYEFTLGMNTIQGSKDVN
jgi:hypothetical protein